MAGNRQVKLLAQKVGKSSYCLAREIPFPFKKDGQYYILLVGWLLQQTQKGNHFQLMIFYVDDKNHRKKWRKFTYFVLNYI